MHAKFWLEILKDIDNLRDEGADAEAILRGTVCDSMDWFNLVEDRLHWRLS
jgi:hypothetical protein